MVVAQKLKEAEITEQDSLLLTRNLLRIAIFNISYIRGLFPEKYFNDKSVPALEMKIKKLMPVDAESRRLIDWMEKGVYDALQKKFLKTLLFCICEDLEGPMIEEYAFSFNYGNSKGEEVSMIVSRSGNKKNGATFKSTATDITPDQMRSSACKMIRTLVQLMRTLDKMPEERTILMKLLYYDDVTVTPILNGTQALSNCYCIRCCSENEANTTWTKNPLKMEVGNVNSKHFMLALKVKSILDPCEDENEDHEDEEVSLGEDSLQDDDSSSSDSEIRPSFADRYVVAPAGGEKDAPEDNDMVSEAETEDPAHEEEQTARVKEWIKTRHVNTVDLTDILSNFPDISVALAEDIMGRLLKEGLLSKTGKDSYILVKEKELNPIIAAVKEEEMQETPRPEKTHKQIDEDMYMKALFHSLPMDYVTVSKLQSKLDGEANQNTVRKLIDKMTRDGYLANSGNRRLGKRVIHSELSNRKLLEVKKALENKPMDMEIDTHAKPFEFNGADPHPNGHAIDGSTCGGLHSIGSDFTRTQLQNGTHQNGSIRSGQMAQTKAQEQGNTPTSRATAAPISSLESGIVGKEDEKVRSRASCGGDESHSTQDKRQWKASMVKEPIQQYYKRQKCLAQ